MNVSNSKPERKKVVGPARGITKLRVQAVRSAAALPSHSFRYVDTGQRKRLGKSFAHHVDEVKQRQLPAGVGLTEDAMVMIEIVEALGEPEGVLGEDGRFFAGHGLVDCHFELSCQQGQLPKLATAIGLEEGFEPLGGN